MRQFLSKDTRGSQIIPNDREKNSFRLPFQMLLILEETKTISYKAYHSKGIQEEHIGLLCFSYERIV